MTPPGGSPSPPIAQPGGALLEARGITVNYGKVRVLRGVGLSVARGDTLAIIGPNGAGKTTLFKALTGELRPGGGWVRFDGADVSRHGVAERTRLGMGRTFQVARVFPDLTVEQNLVLAAESASRNQGRHVPLIPIAPQSRIRAAARMAADDVGLGSRWSMAARFLSHGDRKRLEIAMALSLGPRLLMMDEPMAGMSSADRQDVLRLIERIRRERDLAVVLTEHDMDVVFHLAGQLMVLNYGEVIAHGLVDDVRHDPRVRDVYLGSASHA